MIAAHNTTAHSFKKFTKRNCIKEAMSPAERRTRRKGGCLRSI